MVKTINGSKEAHKLKGATYDTDNQSQVFKRLHIVL